MDGAHEGFRRPLAHPGVRVTSLPKNTCATYCAHDQGAPELMELLEAELVECSEAVFRLVTLTLHRRP